GIAFARTGFPLSSGADEPHRRTMTRKLSGKAGPASRGHKGMFISLRPASPRHAVEYGANELWRSSITSVLVTGGNARCEQPARSQTLQPAPIGVRAAGSFRTTPCE